MPLRLGRSQPGFGSHSLEVCIKTCWVGRPSLFDTKTKVAIQPRWSTGLLQRGFSSESPRPSLTPSTHPGSLHSPLNSSLLHSSPLHSSPLNSSQANLPSQGHEPRVLSPSSVTAPAAPGSSWQPPCPHTTVPPQSTAPLHLHSFLWNNTS